MHTLLNTVQTIYLVFIDFNDNTVHCVFAASTAYITNTAQIVFINIVAYTACTASTAVRSCVDQQGDINCGAFLHSELFPRKFSISSQSGWQAGTTNVTLLGNTGLYWAVTDSPRLY